MIMREIKGTVEMKGMRLPIGDEVKEKKMKNTRDPVDIVKERSIINKKILIINPKIPIEGIFCNIKKRYLGKKRERLTKLPKRISEESRSRTCFSTSLRAFSYKTIKKL